MSTGVLKFVTVFLTTIALFGCSGGSGGGASPAANLNADTVAPTSDPMGIFKSTREDSSAVNRVSNCSQPYKFKIDDRLAAGQEFEIEDKWSAVEGGFSGQGHVRYVIDAIDRQKGTINSTIHIYAPQGSFWLKQLCVYRSDNGLNSSANCQMTSTNFPSSGGSGGPVSYQKSCYIDYNQNRKSTQKIEVGTYTLKKSGKTLSSVRAIEHEEGDIVCKGKNSGTGTREKVQIYADEIPEFQHLVCGGATTVFQYEVVKDSAGNTVSVNKHEIIDAKI